MSNPVRLTCLRILTFGSLLALSACGSQDGAATKYGVRDGSHEPPGAPGYYDPDQPPAYSGNGDADHRYNNSGAYNDGRSETSSPMGNYDQTR